MFSAKANVSSCKSAADPLLCAFLFDSAKTNAATCVTAFDIINIMRFFYAEIIQRLREHLLPLLLQLPLREC